MWFDGSGSGGRAPEIGIGLAKGTKPGPESAAEALKGVLQRGEGGMLLQRLKHVEAC